MVYGKYSYSDEPNFSLDSKHFPFPQYTCDQGCYVNIKKLRVAGLGARPGVYGWDVL